MRNASAARSCSPLSCRSNEVASSLLSNVRDQQDLASYDRCAAQDTRGKRSWLAVRCSSRSVRSIDAALQGGRCLQRGGEQVIGCALPGT